MPFVSTLTLLSTSATFHGRATKTPRMLWTPLFFVHAFMVVRSSASPLLCVTDGYREEPPAPVSKAAFVDNLQLLERWRRQRYFRDHFSERPDTVLLAGHAAGIADTFTGRRKATRRGR